VQQEGPHAGAGLALFNNYVFYELVTVVVYNDAQRIGHNIGIG